MVNTLFLGIVIFLIVLAVFDLVVGVSNDAVNFLNSAIGAKVAKFKTIVLIAAIGVFAGAAMSNGMMDVARHGIMTPAYFSFYDVMCVFLAVMVTDVILLDIFNTLGMPTSTTVSMVFELLGGAFAVALIKAPAFCPLTKALSPQGGRLLELGDLLNTSKALTCILGIFLSVVVAFFFGTLVMWIARIIFTFKYPKVIGWISRSVVLFGTGLLAFSFASNDLVNFVGVPLTGLDAYNDYMANGTGDAQSFMMTSLMESAHTPTLYLVLAGVVMVLALVFSKKAQNVVKTSVDLSRQDEGDEMFGSSAVARILVRNTQKAASAIAGFIPKPVGRWIDSRFNADVAVLPEGAAFDQIRAAVNLVLAGLLVAFGTSMKLPLSTTYVTFMVAMGSSLADRAWSRESAVFRITGVLSVIGGWFITAGAAFIMCYLVTNFLHFGSFVAMGIAVIVAITLLVRSHLNPSTHSGQANDQNDLLFKQLLRTKDKNECWQLLRMHISLSMVEQLQFANATYQKVATAFLQEEYRPLRQATHEIETARKQLKRARRREIIGLRKIDPILAVEKNTWYFLANSSMEQMQYCLKRINDPCREHIGNNFMPVSGELTYDFLRIQKQIDDLFQQAEKTLTDNTPQPPKGGDTQQLLFPNNQIDQLRLSAASIQNNLSDYRKRIIDTMQQQTTNIESTTVFLNLIQESQQMLSCLRHALRGVQKFGSLPCPLP